MTTIQAYQRRACILSVSGEELSPAEAEMLEEYQPWGLILMGRSTRTRLQVRDLVDSIWAALKRPCLIFIDQEGGRVRRLRPPEWPEFPAAEIFAKLYHRDPEVGLEACRLGHRLIASELEPLGINANCAPVLDLLFKDAHDIIGDRAFGAATEQVAALGQAALFGLAEGGVVGVIKHIPGHGRASLDSHEALPVVDASRTLLERDFAPFTALNHAPMAMTAHIAYKALDKTGAATVSPTVIKKTIRSKIGFDGLLMSDDLGMKALGGSLTERAAASIKAGCDVVLHCAGFSRETEVIYREMLEVAKASPVLTGKSLERANAAERSVGTPKSIDLEEAWARFDDYVTTGQSMVGV